jgi:hypothetical protein
MATPLIRIPQEQGGTMYAFSSAARDLTRAYYNPDINFEYSKFALLEIPVVSAPSNGENYIQFDNLFEGGPLGSGGIAPSYTPNTDANVDFAETLQNYALNFENCILTDDDFDEAIYSSDAEKIFFKWMHHLGAFEVKTANSQQVVSGYSRAIENEDTTNTGNNYNRLVKYIGNIDVSNDKNYQGNTYNEIFVNVPSSVGYTPDILFKSSDYNTTATSYTTNSEINGRNGQTHPDINLSLGSLGDNQNGTIDIDPANAYNYGIEWNSLIYSKIANDPKLNNFLEYSKRGGDFRFNAILVYYDLYSKSNIANRSTNLYGIIILDNFKNDPTSTGWYIPELTKYKPNDVTGLNGNAFALKLNVKFNSSLDNVGVESNINDYSTFSMDIFLDTTTALENAARLMVEANNRYASIVDRLARVEDVLMTSNQAVDFSARIADLELALENAALNFATSTSIIDMITSVNSRLNQVISGSIPTEVQYNTDVLVPGNGIKIDKSNPTKIKIANDNNGYSLSDIFNYDIVGNATGDLINAANLFNMSLTASTGIITRIKPFDNLIRIHTSSDSLTGDLNIYLDDNTSTWKKGQIVKFSFKNAIPALGTYKINIYTDKVNGWILKASLETSNMLSQKPYAELICVDEINKTFELEIIR